MNERWENITFSVNVAYPNFLENTVCVCEREGGGGLNELSYVKHYFTVSILRPWFSWKSDASTHLKETHWPAVLSHGLNFLEYPTTLYPHFMGGHLQYCSANLKLPLFLTANITMVLQINIFCPLNCSHIQQNTNPNTCADFHKLVSAQCIIICKLMQ